MSICLSARISPEPYARSLSIFVYVAYGHGSVLLRSRCDTLCTSGFVDNIMFFYNGPYNGMNFATKNDSLKFTYLPQSRTEFNFLLLKGIT